MKQIIAYSNMNTLLPRRAGIDLKALGKYEHLGQMRKAGSREDTDSVSER